MREVPDGLRTPRSVSGLRPEEPLNEFPEVLRELHDVVGRLAEAHARDLGQLPPAAPAEVPGVANGSGGSTPRRNRPKIMLTAVAEAENSTACNDTPQASAATSVANRQMPGSVSSKSSSISPVVLQVRREYALTGASSTRTSNGEGDLNGDNAEEKVRAFMTRMRCNQHVTTGSEEKGIGDAARRSDLIVITEVGSGLGAPTCVHSARLPSAEYS